MNLAENLGVLMNTRRRFILPSSLVLRGCHAHVLMGMPLPSTLRHRLLLRDADIAKRNDPVVSLKQQRAGRTFFRGPARQLDRGKCL